MSSGARLVITNYKQGILTFIMDQNNMQMIDYSPRSNEARIGDIFVAKVLHIVKNINAAFILYGQNEKGYLPIEKQKHVVLLNRSYDGRILAGDEILVQLEKEAIRTKEPVFTTNLSISGKYCVITTGNLIKGVSAKIAKEKRELLVSLLPKDIPYGVIIRTNAAALIETNQLDKVAAEIQTNVQAMNQLLQNATHRTCFSKIYETIPEYLQIIRDEYQGAFSSIITDIPEVHEQLQQYFAAEQSPLLEQLNLYQDNSYSLDKLYGVTTKVEELLNKKVWLKSGANIVIEQTEAMYVIDVNSSKNIAKKDNEQYIFQINLEAAQEIMRQIRLRNLSGIIVIDFINMENKEFQEKLFTEMERLARLDLVKTSIVDMTALGLLEITRKKTKKSLKQQLSVDNF